MLRMCVTLYPGYDRMAVVKMRVVNERAGKDYVQHGAVGPTIVRLMLAQDMVVRHDDAERESTPGEALVAQPDEACRAGERLDGGCPV